MTMTNVTVTNATLSVEYHCSACNLVEREVYEIAIGAELPKPRPPAGWRKIAGELFCSNHEICLSVDGKPRKIGAELVAPLIIPSDCAFCPTGECGEFEAVGYIEGDPICRKCLDRLKTGGVAR